MTQTSVIPALIPLGISLTCCLRRDKFLLQSLPSQNRYFIFNDSSVLAQPLLLMASQPPPQVRHPFKFTSYCILSSLQVIALFSLGCSYSSFQLPGGQGHKTMLSLLCRSTKETAASSFSHFKRKIRNKKSAE